MENPIKSFTEKTDPWSLLILFAYLGVLSLIM